MLLSSKAGHRLDRLRQSGSFKVLFPRVEDQVQAVLLNTAGGITGGDRFTLQAHAGADSTLCLTTQAAERVYAARAGETGRVRNRLSAAPGARLLWLPQETLLYRNCALVRSLEVDLEPGAELTLCEPLVFGRAAMGERLTAGHLREQISVTRAGAPLYHDRMTLDGDIAGHLARPGVARGAGAMATLVHVSPRSEALLPQLRALLPVSAGASLIGADLLVLRALADDSFDLRRFLIPVLTRLAGQALPRPWTL